MTVPISDFTGYKTENTAPQMSEMESLRRILWLLNSLVASAGVPVTTYETDGDPVTGHPFAAGKDDLGIARYIRVDQTGRLQVDLQASDIQIGAVEIKDATSDQRVSVVDNELQVHDTDILGQLDTTLTGLISNIRGVSDKTLTDVDASVADVGSSIDTMDSHLTAQLDITLSALRDALRGTGSKTLTDLESDLANILLALSNKTQQTRLTDGTNDLVLKTAAPATNDVAVPVRNIPSGTQDVAVTSSALPTGAATDSSLQSILTELQGKTEPADQQHVIVDSSALPTGAATQTSLASVDGKLPALVTGRVPVDGSGVNQPITVASLPLPAGAATYAEQSNQTGWMGALTNDCVGSGAQTVATDDTGTWTIVQLLKRLLVRMTALIGGIVATTSGNSSIQTQATGSNWSTLGSRACKRVIIVNNQGVSLDVRQGGAGVAIPVFHTMVFVFDGLANANELSVKRTDSSNTQLTFVYRWEA